MPYAKRSSNIDDILVDFPQASDLAIFWAEQIKLDLSAPSFGWGPIPWDIMDMHLTMRGGLMALMEEVARAVISGYRIVFFLPGKFDIARHLHSIRSSVDDVAAMSSWERGDFDPYFPPKADIVLVRDLETLATLSERSMYLGLLMDVTTGQPENESWVYFLTRPEVITDGGWELEV